MTAGAGLRGRPAIRVIARREIRERGRDRATLISTLVTLAILAGVVVIPSLLGAGAGRCRPAAQRRRRRAGARDPRAAPLAADEVGEEDASGLSFIVLLVLYGQLLTDGFVVATGVVEEKQSRIVELVLSAIRPRDLLAGKVLGVGVVGLVQLLILGAVGLALAAATGRLDVGGSGAAGAVGVAVAWFLLGYALFACAFAIGGALVSRQEELQSTTAPITMAVIGSFLVCLSALGDPGSSLATVLSFIPTCTPLVMPIRQIAGEAPAGEVVGGVLVMLAAIALLIAIAGRVYGNAVLRTGARVSLRGALKRAAA